MTLLALTTIACIAAEHDVADVVYDQERDAVRIALHGKDKGGVPCSMLFWVRTVKQCQRVLGY